MFFADQHLDKDSGKRQQVLQSALQRGASYPRKVSTPNTRDPSFYKNVKLFYGDESMAPLPHSRKSLEADPAAPSPFSRKSVDEPIAPGSPPSSRQGQAGSKLQGSQLRGSREGSGSGLRSAKPIILMPIEFPLKMLSTYLSDNILISMPNGMTTDGLNSLLDLYGVHVAGSEVWLLLKGEDRERGLITALRDMGAKVRGLGIISSKL